jgi:hypothetical protein
MAMSFGLASARRALPAPPPRYEGVKVEAQYDVAGTTFPFCPPMKATV